MQHFLAACGIFRAFTGKTPNCVVENCRPIVQLIEDPWIQGNPLLLSRLERRAIVAQAPDMPSHVAIYNADGASRRTPEGNVGSCGALLTFNGVVCGEVAIFLGDHTNNEAEYCGALNCLKHILAQPCRHVILRLDSMLVVKQLMGVWSCKAANLVPSYQRGLALIARIRINAAYHSFSVQHVYREFNAHADSLANQAIDSYRCTSHQDSVVADQNWRNFSAASAYA